jgi:hypothetical protein
MDGYNIPNATEAQRRLVNYEGLVRSPASLMALM